MDIVILFLMVIGLMLIGILAAMVTAMLMERIAFRPVRNAGTATMLVMAASIFVTALLRRGMALKGLDPRPVPESQLAFARPSVVRGVSRRDFTQRDTRVETLRLRHRLAPSFVSPRNERERAPRGWAPSELRNSLFPARAH